MVTGAWADPDDGCAHTVYAELRRLSRGRIPVVLSEHAASEADADEARTVVRPQDLDLSGAVLPEVAS